ncbi:MAG TPA: hypothetical protein VEH49_02855 [Methylomirabilota bacterium]|nr:hypothetical protein [Methylomirabilota bacterium]
MRKLALPLILLLFLAASLSGQSSEWKTYKNTDGNFQVLFPGAPTDSENPGSEAVRSHTLIAKQNSGAYTVVYAAMSSDQAVDEANFQAYKNGVLQELAGCSVDKETPALPAVRSYVGRYYRLACEKIYIVGNLYWGKRYAYAVMAMFPNGTPESADIRRFLDSFSVLNP